MGEFFMYMFRAHVHVTICTTAYWQFLNAHFLSFVHMLWILFLREDIMLPIQLKIMVLTMMVNPNFNVLREFVEAYAQLTGLYWAKNFSLFSISFLLRGPLCKNTFFTCSLIYSFTQYQTDFHQFVYEVLAILIL